MPRPFRGSVIVSDNQHLRVEDFMLQLAGAQRSFRGTSGATEDSLLGGEERLRDHLEGFLRLLVREWQRLLLRKEGARRREHDSYFWGRVDSSDRLDVNDAGKEGSQIYWTLLAWAVGDGGKNGWITGVASENDWTVEIAQGETEGQRLNLNSFCPFFFLSF